MPIDFRAIRWLCILAVAWFALAATLDLRADVSPPLVTAKNAGQFVDKPASVEFTVVETKFAQRRQIHFLSGTPNFRSEDNVPVAIRAVDFPAFEKAGIKDLSARYLGRKIRARGAIARDEGQWLLLVSSAEQVETLDDVTKTAAAGELVIMDDHGNRTVLKVPLPADLPRSKVKLMHEGQEEAYEGVKLTDLLAKADIAMGAESRGNLLGRYMIVRAHDKYAAVYSLFEVDPYYVEPIALLAESVNGGPLKATRAPLQVVMPGDKHRRRWVGQVIEIEVRNALEMPQPGAR